MMTPYLYHLSRAIEEAPSEELKQVVLDFLRKCQDRVIHVSGGGPQVRITSKHGLVLAFRVLRGQKVPNSVYLSLKRGLGSPLMDVLESIKVRGEKVTVILC